MNPEMEMYTKRLLVFAHPTPSIARVRSNASSQPLDCVRSTPATPTKKRNIDDILDSREYAKVYAEIIAITGQMSDIGPTVPRLTVSQSQADMPWSFLEKMAVLVVRAKAVEALSFEGETNIAASPAALYRHL
jgi:hypothetical protein